MSEPLYIIPLTFYGIAFICFSIAGYYIVKDLINNYKDE